ncbi:MAG: hypothetical protein EXS00_02335 [Phycisphaerales bacterium]|nr:hypothetical protein [Phycisphaerales bacterium]
MSLSSEPVGVGSFTGSCALRSTPIAPGVPFVAALVDASDDAVTPLKRLDICAEAWDAGERPAGLVAFWRSIAPLPGAPRQTFVDDETLLEILQRLGEDASGRRASYRWLVALILLRKRLLKHAGIDRNAGAETWLFKVRGSEDDAPLLRVLNPQVLDEELRDLSDQLAEVVRIEA